MLKYSDCNLQAERGKNLICIIMNLNENIRKNEKSWKNQDWHTYNFAHISLNKYL